MEVSGNLIFNGDILMQGLGWNSGGGGGGDGGELPGMVAALVPQVGRVERADGGANRGRRCFAGPFASAVGPPGPGRFAVGLEWVGKRHGGWGNGFTHPVG